MCVEKLYLNGSDGIRLVDLFVSDDTPYLREARFTGRGVEDLYFTFGHDTVNCYIVDGDTFNALCPCLGQFQLPDKAFKVWYADGNTYVQRV